MKIKKWGAVVACGALVATLGLFGCSSNNSSSSASSSAAADNAAAEYTLMKEGTLTFATSPDFPPFENLDGDEYVGFDIDLAQAIAEKMGLECEFTTIQFDGIVPAIQAGGQADVGISGITVDPDRAKSVDFTDPYYIADQSVAVMKGGEVTADNVDEALNAEGMIIAVQSGTTGETFAQENFPNATVQPYGNATDAFAAMQAGQANAVCMDKAVVEKMLADAYTDAEVVKNVATGEEYAVAVSKDNTGLLEAINKAIAELQADGTIDDLTTKWLS
ncbi:MAG: transporter substrate-binding domain-containing protein [Eggerthellaceae bacterium]|nr:transporter substrate-binding domain-containing protein [Eggerthellaceae bacterium]